MSDTRRNLATAGTGATLVGGGAQLRHMAMQRALRDVPRDQHPWNHALYMARKGKPARKLFWAGHGVGAVGAIPLAAGTAGLVRRQSVGKAEKTPLWREGVAGTAESLKSRGESLKVKQPADVRGIAIGTGLAAGLTGGRLAHLALRKHPQLRPVGGSIAGTLAATAAIPLANRAIQRKHPDYQVTATGVKRKITPPKKPSGKAFTAPSTHRNLRADVTKAEGYLGSRTPYRTQRAAITGAGGVPVVGPYVQAHTAGSFAPPGQRHKTAVRQFAMGPAAGNAAGVAAAYGAAHLANHNARFGAAAERGLDRKRAATASARHKVRLDRLKPVESKQLAHVKQTARAVTAPMRAHRLARPFSTPKGAAAGTLAFLGARAVTGGVGGQMAITRSQNEQRAYNTRHHIAKAMATMAEREQAQRKRRQARGGQVGGATNLAALGVLALRKEKVANRIGIVGGAIGGANALYGARVARGDANVLEKKPIGKALPAHAIHRSFGKVRVLGQHSKDHFLVLTNRDERRLIHRDQLTFTNRPGPVGKGWKQKPRLHRMGAQPDKLQLLQDGLLRDAKYKMASHGNPTRLVAVSRRHAPIGVGKAAKGWTPTQIEHLLTQHKKARLVAGYDKKAVTAQAFRDVASGVVKRDAVEIRGTKEEHKRLIAQYGDRGPLPAGLDRDIKMKAYEARYVHAGGDKSEKWNRRASAAEGSRNLALAAGTGGLAGLAALRHPRAARVLRRHPKLSHRIDTTALTAGAAGGASEMYGEYARHKRRSYDSSPGGVARSALTRMRAYTPGD